MSLSERFSREKVKYTSVSFLFFIEILLVASIVNFKGIIVIFNLPSAYTIKLSPVLKFPLKTPTISRISKSFLSSTSNFREYETSFFEVLLSKFSEREHPL